MINKIKFVSVILPNYNYSRFLVKSITSVLNQTYKNFELIIVDDCSTDDSLKIIRYFKKIDKRVRYFKTKKNSGTVSIPRNLGITKSKGNYVAFIDADDYWYPDKLNYQITNLKNYLVSFTAANYEIEGGKKKSDFFVNIFRIFLQKFFLNKIKNKGYHWLYLYNPFLVSSALIQKKIIIKYNFVTDPEIREDLNLWINLFRSLNKKFIFHHKILITITRTKLSMSSNKVEEFNKIINCLNKNILKVKEYNFFHFFILGIFLRTAKMLLSNIYKNIKKKAKIISFSIIVIYFIIYYSPLFFYLGKKIIYYDNVKKTDALVVISGQKGFSYFNDSYKDRFVDIIHYLEKFNGKKNTKIYLYGKLEFIPSQKILEALLINESINKENIIVIYEEYNSINQAVEIIFDKIKKDKISNVTFITSPYNTYRLHKLISSKKNYPKTYIFENFDTPKKNNFFQRSFNKKEIIYEYLSIAYNKIKGNF